MIALRSLGLGFAFAVGVVFAGACGSSGGATCVEGQSVACTCTDGTTGAQVCQADHTFGACMCTGGIDAAPPTVDAPPPAIDANQIDADPLAGHVYYAGMFPGAGSVWANLPGAGGLTGLEAGNAQCVALGVGADHVCDYTEVLAAQMNGELATIPAATTAWVQRTTPAMVMGMVSQPGPGGNCNNWTYATNHIGDGEYLTFDVAGVPTYHLDNDTIFDPAQPGVHTIPGDLECGGATRSILCCYALPSP